MVSKHYITFKGYSQTKIREIKMKKFMLSTGIAFFFQKKGSRSWGIIRVDGFSRISDIFSGPVFLKLPKFRLSVKFGNSLIIC